MESSGITTGPEQAGAEDALWWAAMTYVAGALSSLIILGYLVFSLMSKKR
ncbi:MAG: Zn-dependent membrane protease YugP [Polaribacter sp.]